MRLSLSAILLAGVVVQGEKSLEDLVKEELVCTSTKCATLVTECVADDTCSSWVPELISTVELSRKNADDLASGLKALQTEAESISPLVTCLACECPTDAQLSDNALDQAFKCTPEEEEEKDSAGNWIAAKPVMALLFACAAARLAQ